MTEPTGRRGRWALLPVLLLVNGAAVWGQAGWGLDHIVPAEWTSPAAALGLALAFAAAIELIGVFLSLSADDAEDRGLPSGGIRLGSYAIGLVSGALNYSHWNGAAAIAFALLSAISPFLWGINSRVNRARPIAPSRRFWHPVRSVKLIRHMAWEGIALEQDGMTSMTSVPIAPAPAPAPLPEISELPPAREITEIEQRAADLLGITLTNPRKPRAAKADQEKAVRLMLDGKASEAIEAGLMGASTMRRYQQVWRTLKANPLADDFGSATGKVAPELVALIRERVTDGAA